MTLPVLGDAGMMRVYGVQQDSPPHLVEGLRLTSWKVIQDVVDVTTAADPSWHRLLSGAGHRSVELRLEGLCLGSTGEVLLRDAALSGAVIRGEIDLDASTMLRGPFVVVSLELASGLSEETVSKASLRSAGPVTLD